MPSMGHGSSHSGRSGGGRSHYSSGGRSSYSSGGRSSYSSGGSGNYYIHGRYYGEPNIEKSLKSGFIICFIIAIGVLLTSILITAPKFKLIKDDSKPYFEMINVAKKNPSYIRYATSSSSGCVGGKCYHNYYVKEGNKQLDGTTFYLTLEGYQKIQKEIETTGYIRIAIDSLDLEYANESINMNYSLDTDYEYQEVVSQHYTLNGISFFFVLVGISLFVLRKKHLKTISNKEKQNSEDLDEELIEEESNQKGDNSDVKPVEKPEMVRCSYCGVYTDKAKCKNCGAPIELKQKKHKKDDENL